MSRPVELNLSTNWLTGEIPALLGVLTNIKWLFLSRNELTGEFPVEFGSLSNLLRLHVSENPLTRFIPGELRDVEDNNLDELGPPFCDGLLSGLSVSPGWLVPSFDPYNNEYTVAAGQVRVTVVPVNDHDGSVLFLDEHDVTIPEADDNLPGHQVDFSPDLSAIRFRVVSADGQASRTYTIADLGIKYDTDENRVIDGSETMAAIADYVGERIAREEAIGIVRLNFLGELQRVFANNPLLPFRGVPRTN